MATKKVAAAAPAKKGCGCKSAAKKEEIVKVAVKPAAKKEMAPAAKPAVKKAVAKVAAAPAAATKKVAPASVAKKAAPAAAAKKAAPAPVAKKAAAPKTSAPAKASKSAETVFSVYSPASASVAVAGEFNDWNVEKGAMKKGEDGMWNLKVKLAPGSYEYKIVYDGQHWSVDNSNPERVADGQGGENSIKHV